ncbi:hypothetical protein V2J09_010622 [Rumex salicifolius]
MVIGQEVLEAMTGLWKNCTYVKVLGRSMPLPLLDRKLREVWKSKGAMSVVDLPRHFFLVHFDSEDGIETTPVWVRVSNIPMIYYHRMILMRIVEGIGKPLKVDMVTLKFERGRFAGICIEVNLHRPLKGSITINGSRYFVSYEGLNTICFRCGIYGHLVMNFPRAKETDVGVTAKEGGVKEESDGRESINSENAMVVSSTNRNQDEVEISGIEKSGRRGPLVEDRSPAVVNTIFLSGEALGKGDS